MATQIKLRRDTYQNWFDNNPVLGLAEPGFDTTNKKLKIGDGTTAWRDLAYFDDKETVLSAVTQDIVPATDNTYDIGSPDKRWRHGYFATGSLYVGDIKLSNDNGTLLVQQVTNAGLISEAPVPNTPGAVTTDRIVNGAQIFSITAAGALRNNNSFTKTSMSNITTTSPTVVWTATEDFISGVKLQIQVEANEVGDSSGWHSQVCEAIIASRGYASTYGGPGGDPVMTVYGVTHTSTVPMVTFTVQRNPTTKFIEVVGTVTAATTAADLRIYSVETATRD